MLLSDAAFSNFDNIVCIPWYDGDNRTRSSAYGRMFTKQPEMQQLVLYIVCLVKYFR